MSSSNRLNQQQLSVERLESRNLMTLNVLPLEAPAVVDTSTYGPPEYFVADSFSFGVEREMKESGEKGGTEDINIGVGELQECTVGKSMDAAAADLAFAINGNSRGTAGIDLVEPAQATGSGDADDRPTEEVAFYYNKIAFVYRPTKDGIVFAPSHGGKESLTESDSSSAGYADKEYFIADSFSFGVEREMKESGEKGGTADINIGVGELQECTIGKSTNAATSDLAQFANNGNSPGTARIDAIANELAESLNDPSSRWVGDVDGMFSMDNFSFSVEREMKESGEKGGTEDINIGVGEL